jgi:hypothetical protein
MAKNKSGESKRFRKRQLEIANQLALSTVALFLKQRELAVFVRVALELQRSMCHKIKG